MVKSLPAILETGVQTLGWEDALEKIPWRRAWQPTPIFLPGECHGQRSLVSYSPWGHKESDTTEWLTHTVLEQGFLGGTRGKNLPANAGNIRDMGSIPGLGRSPRKGMATHSSILAWRIPKTEEPDKLQSIGLQRVRHDWSYLAHSTAVLEQWNEPDPSKSPNFPFVLGWFVSCWVYLIKNLSDASYCPITRMEIMIEKKMLHFYNFWSTLLNYFWDKQCTFNFIF